ncbi:MAG: hypothetical protein V3U75_12265 [Methylococcaceae bacterium]
MNNYDSINTKQIWEPEELEFWELDDFVDVIQQHDKVSMLEQSHDSYCSLQSIN